jgi:uncharacterized protein YeaO (DUF488 family)
MAEGRSITTFRIGEMPKGEERLRLGVTRLPPRGVPKSRWPDLFDVWFPLLAPSKELFATVRKIDFDDPKARKRFFDRYEKEVTGDAEKRQTLEAIAALGKRTPIAVGCFCADESRCHRWRLAEILERIARA